MLVLVLAGFIIVSVGVVGLYVGRIFEQVKDRPLFLIDAETSGPDRHHAPSAQIPAEDPARMTASRPADQPASPPTRAELQPPAST